MNLSDLTATQACAVLSNHPDYQVLRRLTPQFHPSDRPGLSRGVVLDVETTGNDTARDAVIELGMVLFEYDPLTGVIHGVLEAFNQLEQPPCPIPPEATAVNGITDAMVVGKRINEADVEQFLAGVDLVIAHNAKFDRAMVERRLPIFADLPWACSLAQVDWAKEGMGSAKLDYLLYRFGFFHHAHRAEMDCHALLEILRHTLPVSGEGVLKTLLKTTAQNGYTLSALNSPFATKDSLKARGYRWNAEQKCWGIALTSDAQLSAEIVWLKANVYGGFRAQVRIEAQDSLVRYSSRAGRVEVRDI